MPDTIKHPEITLKLVGEDGNAYAILGRAMRAMRTARLPQAEQDAFMAEAKSGDYNHLLRTCMEWFSADEEEDADDD